MNEIMDDIVKKFRRIYIGDSLIRNLSLDFLERRCVLLMSSVSLLKDDEKANIFDVIERYAPAFMTFDEVKSIACPEGAFYLNATVVEFEAVAEANGDLVTFRMVMTGGYDNESFMRSLVIEAKGFSFGPAPHAK
jgi:hypothetical protein